MLSGPSTRRSSPTAIKILIAGDLGVGKTTLVASVSEIMPLSTEEILTDAGASSDDLSGVESKRPRPSRWTSAASHR